MIIVVDEPCVREGCTQKMLHKKGDPFVQKEDKEVVGVEENGPTINKWLISPSENMQPTRRTMENKLSVSNQESRSKRSSRKPKVMKSSMWWKKEVKNQGIENNK